MLAVLLIGSSIYLVGTKINPSVVTKSDSISTTVSTATVNKTTGVVTVTAP